ncbi:MAG: GTPase HflX [Ignavibacteria bacterium]|nr:GTPase HflX [Ignavibacteria bacterium]
MIEIVQNIKEKAILVSVRMKDASAELVREHLDELEMLAETAGAETVLRITQDRDRFDPAFYIGKGKVEEIAELTEMNEINLIIFDDDLSPTQTRNLEKVINKKIVDRSGLILDIFASHAKTNQAKTQVELAQNQYMLSRLTRAWTHLSKQYGGIGTKGPGETQIETDRRIIRERITHLKEKLRKIELQQTTKSSARKNLINASIVGYTNAGKSTLINCLTDAEVLAENKLFATLDSTSRSLDLDKGKKVIISDTVGFIRKLPHNLIESFKTTLQVVRDADIIIHVIDITNMFFEDHIRVVDETLAELKCENKPQLMLFNKIDALKEKQRLDYVRNKYPRCIPVSAQRGINISGLNSELLNFYEKNFGINELEIPLSKSALVFRIHSLAEVISTEYDENSIIIKFRTDPVTSNKIKGIVNDAVNKK